MILEFTYLTRRTFDSLGDSHETTPLADVSDD